MTTINKMCECVKCKKNTLHIINTPNHILHLLLTVFTAGAWLLVWIFQKNTKPQCIQCGHTKSWWNDAKNADVGTSDFGYRLAKKIKGTK